MQAFLDQYKKFPMFSGDDSTAELEDSRSANRSLVNAPVSHLIYFCSGCSETVRSLLDEYRAAEKPDYISWRTAQATGA